MVRLPVNILLSQLVEYLCDGLMVLSSFKAEIPPLSTKLLKVREDNYKVKYERGKGKGEVNAERLSCNDWFSSIQLTFMGGTAAVKANHFT